MLWLRRPSETMPAPCTVSIVLSTFNRADLLGPAIDRLMGQCAASPPYELIVVDNNSTDETRAVVDRRLPSHGARLQYVLEPQQGLSHARNAGIAAARADIVAFTDDDVRVADDWVKVISETFDCHPDVDCLGGRTLPVWPSTPPGWLTRLHWVGPLALQDYGDEPFVVDAQKVLCLAGANLAFRKVVFARIGLFSPDFPRSEDTELMLRLWLSGAQALYVPAMTVYAAVQSNRLGKAYHRAWHHNIGRCNARMAFEEMTAAGGGLRSELPEFPRLFGIPLFAFRQLAGETWRWLRETFRRDESQAFWHELQVRALLGYIRESRALRRAKRYPVWRGPSGRACAIPVDPSRTQFSEKIRP